MFFIRTLLFTLIILLLSACAPNRKNPVANAQSPSDDPVTLPKDSQETCPITTPQDPVFVPPEPYPETAYKGYFWYGTNALWTAVPEDGVWSLLPHNPKGYTQKLPWWREGYSWTDEPKSELKVTGRRLDAPAPELFADDATNAYETNFLSTMLVGVDFPTLGCWEITGHYAGNTLSFVVWIAP